MTFSSCKRVRACAVRAFASAGMLLALALAAPTPALAALAAPTGLTATTPTNQPPALSWNAVATATSYRVFRNGTQIAKPTTTSYVDTGVRAGGSYKYKVKAVRGGTVSAASAPFTVVFDVTAPSVPGGVTAASPTQTPPLVSWNASTDDRAGVALYRVLRDGALVGTTTGRSFTDSGVAAAGTYAYAVQAVDGAGNSSAASPAVSVVYQPSGGGGGSGPYTGVSSRLTGTDVAGEKTRHPELRLVSILLRWRNVEAANDSFDWGTLDAALADARARDYRVIVRILCGADAPAWLYDVAGDHPVTMLDLLANDPASSYKGEIFVPLPWDPDLRFHYNDLLRALDAHLRGSDGAGGTLADHVYFVPIAMPTLLGSEMSVGYGSGTYTGTYRGVNGTWDRLATNRAEWLTYATSGSTTVEKEQSNRRDLEAAWRTAIDDHMQILSPVRSAIAYGPLWSDMYASAKAIASSKVAQYPTRLLSMTTNLQPKVNADGTLGPYSAWSAPAAQTIQNAKQAGGAVGFQTAGPTVIDTDAKMRFTIDDGLETYGMHFLETAPAMVDSYVGMLLTDADNLQLRMESRAR
jgi:chitodextrinase